MSAKTEALRERIRITFWSYAGKGWTIRAVPINEDGSVRTNQFMIQLDQSRGNIPVEPAIGQIWNVAGKATSERRPDKSDQIIINWKIIKSEDTETLEFERPNDGESFAQFISADPTFKGIGEGKARALWTKFGEDIFKRLDRGNADDIKELGTILSTKAIKSLFAGYERYKHLSEVCLDDQSWYRPRHSTPHSSLQSHGYGRDHQGRSV